MFATTDGVVCLVTTGDSCIYKSKQEE